MKVKIVQKTNFYIGLTHNIMSVIISQMTILKRDTKIKKLIDGIHKAEKVNLLFLHLTANENQMSKTARSFLNSKLSERYYFGAGNNGVVDYNPFTVRGIREVEDIVLEAEKAVKEMLGATVVNLRCLSGIHAMMSVILCTTEPGDTVMSVHHDHGGHFATAGILNRTGRRHLYTHYDFNKKQFDVDKMARDFKDSNAKALYLDLSYYVDHIDIKKMRQKLGPKAIIIFDASHTMGLILGGAFPNPLQEGADIICGNTHKTLPGPQKGMIAFKNLKFGCRINDLINTCMVSSVHTHHLLSLAVTLLEMKYFGHEYARQVIKNANKIGKELSRLGYKVRKTINGKFSSNHQVHVFIKDQDDREKIYRRLIDNNISTNFDNPLGGELFIRIGVQEVTRRGMKEKEMTTISQLVDRAIKGSNVSKEVRNLNQRFTSVKYSFDKD